MVAPTPERDSILRRFLEVHGLTGLDLRDLDLALTHRSYAYEKDLGYDNERLEFLGDAVIATVTSEFLYERDTHADEGLLSKRRAHLVSRSLLGRRAREIELGELLLLGRGERETGGTQRLSTLGSTLEALVGIVYLRLGFAAARDFVRRHVLESLTRLNAAELAQGDFKSTLQEWAQQRYKMVPAYSRLGEEGPDHDKQFLVQVAVAGRVLAQARGSRIKIAENEAARLALEKIQADELVSE
jgi:ribonuclease-3